MAKLPRPAHAPYLHPCRQRRFWTHLITDQENYIRDIDYIHWNPVKHGLVKQVIDWSHSSFHQFLDQGIYPAILGHLGQFEMDGGE
jgi:putative transposase